MAALPHLVLPRRRHGPIHNPALIPLDLLPVSVGGPADVYMVLERAACSQKVWVVEECRIEILCREVFVHQCGCCVVLRVLRRRVIASSAYRFLITK